jgi:hypothetical protein
MRECPNSLIPSFIHSFILIMAEFAFKDIRVRLLGRDIVGLQDIKYKVMSEGERVYGRGNKALGIQEGNESVEGTITILQSEFEALQAAVRTASPTSKVTDVRFDVVVTYGEGLTAVTDVVQTVKITEYEKGMAQNDKFKAIEMPFIALGVLENV